MKESILDVLLYLFEHYIGDDADTLRDRDPLHDGLIEAGFSPAEISKAFDWLDGLAQQRLAGGFATVNYAYKNRYLLDATFRVDGSSKFGAVKSMGAFTAMRAGSTARPSTPVVSAPTPATCNVTPASGSPVPAETTVRADPAGTIVGSGVGAGVGAGVGSAVAAAGEPLLPPPQADSRSASAMP